MGDNHKILKGGIIGAVVGVVAGLLFAPRSGKETRQIIKTKAEKAAQAAEGELKKVFTELESALEASKEQLETLKGKAKEDYADLRKRAEVAQAKVKELIATVRDGDFTKEELDEIISEAKKAEKALKDKKNRK